MKQKYKAVNLMSEDKPAGGYFRAIGINIYWQSGPLREQGSDEPAAPNGAFVETVIEAARQRLEFYQGTKFACRENALAITKLEEALHWLNARTQRRIEQGVEGTHEGS